VPACALLTIESLEGFVADDELLIPPLAARGWQAEFVPWDSTTACWDDFDLVVIRSTWDYYRRWEEYLEVLSRIEASRAQLHNPLDVVRWNIDKRYLAELETRGATIVPTVWQSSFDPGSLPAVRSQFGRGELIVKPNVSAGADATYRLAASATGDSIEAIAHELGTRRVMLQPMIASVVEVGEYSLFYMGGKYSHAILKTPKAHDFRVQEEYGSSIIPVTPEADLLQASEQVMKAVGRTLLYARVDLARLADGTPAVMELELIEPSLYLRYDEGAAERFAEAVVSGFPGR
jgi:hypothetical protein